MTMTAATRRKLRHRATVNMLRMGHCAPSIARTLLDLTDQKRDWVVKLAAGMPGDRQYRLRMRAVCQP